MRAYLKGVIVALSLLCAGVMVSPSAQVSIQRGWNVVSGYMDIVGASATYKWIVSGTDLLLQSSTGGAFSTVGTFTSGGQLLHPDGTAAAPSITFASDTAKGIFRETTGNYAGMSFVDASPGRFSFLTGAGGATQIARFTTAGLTLSSTYGVHWSSTSDLTSAADVSIARDAAGIASLNHSLRYTGVLFAALGTPTNGTVTYCSDCTPNVAPCTGAGTGAIAKRLNAAWDCR